MILAGGRESLEGGGRVPPPPLPVLRPQGYPKGIRIPQLQPQPHFKPPVTAPNRLHIPCDRSAAAVELPPKPPSPSSKSLAGGVVQASCCVHPLLCLGSSWGICRLLVPHHRFLHPKRQVSAAPDRCQSHLYNVCLYPPYNSLGDRLLRLVPWGSRPLRLYSLPPPKQEVV